MESIIRVKEGSQKLILVIYDTKGNSGSILTAQEFEYSKKLLIKNRAGFVASRSALKIAVEKLGFESFPYLSYDKKPAQVAGNLLFSITHKEEIGAALVCGKIDDSKGISSGIRSLGVDIEKSLFLFSEDKLKNKQAVSTIDKKAQRLIKRICSDSEKRQLDCIKSNYDSDFDDSFIIDRYKYSLKLFSIKESVYKSFYNQYQVSLAFSEIDISIEDNLNTDDFVNFKTKISKLEKQKIKVEIKGAVREIGNLVISYAVLRSA